MLTENILKFLKLDSIIDKLTGYIESRVELLKLELKDDLAKVIAKVAVYGLVAFTITFFVFFLSMATAYTIAERLGYFAGFGIVSGFYLLIALIVILFRKDLDKKVEDKVKHIIRTQKK